MSLGPGGHLRRGVTALELLVALGLFGLIAVSVIAYFVHMSKLSAAMLAENTARSEVKALLDGFAKAFSQRVPDPKPANPGDPPPAPTSFNQNPYPILLPAALGGSPAFATIAQPACATVANAPCQGIDISQNLATGTVRRVRFATECAGAPVVHVPEAPSPFPNQLCGSDGQSGSSIEWRIWDDQTNLAASSSFHFPSVNGGISSAICIRFTENCAPNPIERGVIVDVWYAYLRGTRVDAFVTRQAFNVHDRSNAVDFVPVAPVPTASPTP